jgi:hypothetical protein
VCFFVAAPVESASRAVAAVEGAAVGTCVDGAAAVVRRSASTTSGNVFVDQVQRGRREMAVCSGERVCVGPVVIRSI